MTHGAKKERPRDKKDLVCETCGTAQVDTRARCFFEKPSEVFKKPCHRYGCDGLVFVYVPRPE